MEVVAEIERDIGVGVDASHLLDRAHHLGLDAQPLGEIDAACDDGARAALRLAKLALRGVDDGTADGALALVQEGGAAAAAREDEWEKESERRCAACASGAVRERGRAVVVPVRLRGRCRSRCGRSNSHWDSERSDRPGRGQRGAIRGVASRSVCVWVRALVTARTAPALRGARTTTVGEAYVIPDAAARGETRNRKA